MANKKKPELLLPAKNLEVLKTAIRFGADAVYIGGEAFGLRAKAENFTSETMKEGIDYAHAHGAKVYVAVNILAHNNDLKEARGYLEELSAFGPDGMIIADPALFTLAGELAPNVERHISTQANNTNYETFRFWHSLGATRCVTARELSVAEIKEIHENIPDDLEIETFVHGAMCISYSGRCLLSNYFTGRNANLGECTHPCRWKYALVEEKRPGEYMPVEENERGTYFMSSKDLCMVDHIPELVDAGVDSFKVEGRMKNALYVANAARTYRKAIDDYFTDPALYEKNKDHYLQEITHGISRNFTTGFFFGKPDENALAPETNAYVKNDIYLGIVEEIDENGNAVITQRNRFFAGDKIEIMRPNGQDEKVKVLSILTDDGVERESAPHPKERLHIALSGNASVGDVLRMK